MELLSMLQKKFRSWNLRNEFDVSTKGAYKKDGKPEKPKMQQKTKLIFWLVSHCETDNKREEYAKTLNQYISVDIYG